MDLRSLLKQFPFVYPASIIWSCKDWIDKQVKTGGVYKGIRKHSYKLIQPAEHHTHQLPKIATANVQPDFTQNAFYQTADAYLFDLKDCYLFREMGLVLTNRNRLFQEFTHHFGISSLKRFLIKNPFLAFSANVKQIHGTGAILVSPQSHNYYHWLFDVLPRIKLYGPVMEHIQHFCVARSVPAKFLEVLSLFGIAQDKILLIDDTQKLHFDNLYVASLPGSEGRSPKWAIDFVRSKMVRSDSTNVSRKLYFKRGSDIARKIINEDVVMAIAAAQGFDIIEPDTLSVTEQAQLIQQAVCIVGLHSAALANLLFAQKGTRVLEVYSPDYLRTDCYYTLAQMLELEYHYMVGDKPTNAPWGDIVINEQLFTLKLQELVE